MTKSQKFNSLRAGVAPIVLGLALAYTPAFAQVDTDTQENAVQTSIDTDAGQGTETIIVTGSRIARRDLTSTSPLAVVQDEEFKLSGAVNVEQVINTLPQVIPGATSFSNNPGGGVATLDLRGLGANRNLVLVNGRRWMFFDTSQIVDLNTIPQFLIDSVDVVTGGASAVYGSDAIAGVINFRLRSDLNGFEAGSSYAITERGDGARFNAHVALGTEFADGRGSITVFSEYYKRKSIFAADRDFSNFTAGEGNGVLTTGGGSSTVEQGRFQYAGALDLTTLNGAQGNFADAFFAQPGVSRPRVGTDLFNYAPDNYLMVPQERWLLGGYGEYEISDGLTAYTEVTFVNNRVQNELAATPVTGTFRVNVAQQQPFLSPADFAALQAIDTAEGAAADPGFLDLFIQRRTTDTESRNSFDDRNAYRVLAGIKGPAFANWNYDAYYMYARTRNANVQAGNISKSAFQRGLDGTDAPINIFGAGTLTPSMGDAISILAQNNDISELQVASASLSGSLFNFGMGADDVGLAVGAEWRSMSSRFIPDTALSSGDVIGFNAANPTRGSYDAKEIFGELRIPIIADRPGFHRLEVSGAARYSDYSLENVGGVWTYAGGAEWAPIADLTFRGQYQRAVRAPNVAELFSGGGNGFPAATDPCALPTAVSNATIRDLCVATGVPANLLALDPITGLPLNASVQQDAQIEGIFGGNPNLQEEVSDTYTIGAVIRPSFIPRLAVTVDAYDIKVQNAISVLGGSVGNVLNICYNIVQSLDSAFCQAVNRNPINGRIGGDFPAEVLNANLGKYRTRGIDLQVDYELPLTFGLMGEESKLNFFFLGTYVDKFTITPVVDLPDETNECAGRFGLLACGQPIPRYKWTSRLSWLDGPMTTSFRWRHTGAVRDDDDLTDYVVEKLKAYDLFDLTFSYDVSDEFTMAVGVQNLFDKEPQLIGDNQQQTNTYPGTYDVIGRDYFVSANFRF